MAKLNAIPVEKAREVINVTKTFLPPEEEYLAYLKKVWQLGWITNFGPLALELETKLKERFGVKHVFFVSNGTIALQIAIKACELHSEIITTPFSYVATTSAIAWESCTPVFADIDAKTLCMDPNEIKAHLTPKTTAILATHIYGGAVDINAIQDIAYQHKLKVIYDASHTFDSLYKGKSILNYGDISTLSFHATKIFHTVEGGAIVTNNDVLAHKIAYMRNFGHQGQEAFSGLGINGKNSEFHAAMGLAMLPHVDKLIQKRKEITALYDRLLSHSKIQRPQLVSGAVSNCTYYAIILPDEQTLLRVKGALNDEEIYPRRYFYPALHTLDYVSPSNMPIAENISKRILCLPIFYDLSDEMVVLISEIILAQL